MSRLSIFSSPLFLGFEPLERLLDQSARGIDGRGVEGYPPYNLERFEAAGGQPECWRITLAVAGFSLQDLELSVENSQLLVKGQPNLEAANRDFMHKGIAGRGFSKSFVLADGMEVYAAGLENGMLAIDIKRNPAQRRVIQIDVKDN